MLGGVPAVEGDQDLVEDRAQQVHAVAAQVLELRAHRLETLDQPGGAVRRQPQVPAGMVPMKEVEAKQEEGIGEEVLHELADEEQDRPVEALGVKAPHLAGRGEQQGVGCHRLDAGVDLQPSVARGDQQDVVEQQAVRLVVEDEALEIVYPGDVDQQLRAILLAIELDRTDSHDRLRTIVEKYQTRTGSCIPLPDRFGTS